MPPGLRLTALLLCLCGILFAPAARAQNDPDDEGTLEHPLQPVDTSSPRATLRSFLEESDAGWRRHLESGGVRNPVAGRAIRCLDLSELPPVQQKDMATEAAIHLFDVFNRIPLPKLRDVPDETEMGEETRWVVPNTSIAIARVDDGPRAGEWLFTPEVVRRAENFYDRTRHLPPKRRAVVEDGYAVYIAETPLVPAGWVAALPPWAREVRYGQTLFQWGLLLLVLVLFGLLAALGVRWSRRGAPTDPAPTRRALVGPACLIVLSWGALYLINVQINITGGIYAALRVLLDAVFFLSAAWAALLGGRLLGDEIVSARRFRSDPLAAQLVQISTRLGGLAAMLVFVGLWAGSLGIPVVAVLTGLGVGGIAVALAAQRTLENFIAGITLFADRPVRVGEFCRYGDQVGTVDQIGLRSTRIRSLERTIVTVPNADFSRMQLENISVRDQRLFRPTLQLRFETTPEQLRYVLAKIRELLLGHPKVTPEPARVRFEGYGPGSKNVGIFAYLRCQDQNTFLAIQEDLLLRIEDIVSEAGTAFAIPAQTSYLAQAPALDTERRDEAEARVGQWRSEHRLPFPEFADEERRQLTDALEYPPEGSPDYRPRADAPDAESAPQETGASRASWSRFRRSKRDA